MSILCFLGRHKPSPASMARKKDGDIALCEICGCPLERQDSGAWRTSAPLHNRDDSRP